MSKLFAFAIGDSRQIGVLIVAEMHQSAGVIGNSASANRFDEYRLFDN